MWAVGVSCCRVACKGLQTRLSALPGPVKASSPMPVTSFMPCPTAVKPHVGGHSGIELSVRCSALLPGEKTPHARLGLFLGGCQFSSGLASCIGSHVGHVCNRRRLESTEIRHHLEQGLGLCPNVPNTAHRHPALKQSSCNHNRARSGSRPNTCSNTLHARMHSTHCSGCHMALCGALTTLLSYWELFAKKLCHCIAQVEEASHTSGVGMGLY